MTTTDISAPAGPAPHEQLLAPTKVTVAAFTNSAHVSSATKDVEIHLVGSVFFEDRVVVDIRKVVKIPVGEFIAGFEKEAATIRRVAGSPGEKVAF